MTRTIVSRLVDAPLERVFEVVSDIRNFSKAVPHIIDVQFLTEQTEGVGTRFRETRLLKGKEASTELEGPNLSKISAFGSFRTRMAASGIRFLKFRRKMGRRSSSSRWTPSRIDFCRRS